MPHAHARVGVPPMLHVAFNELPARGKQDVGPRELRARVNKGQRILKLIAEAESSAGLVERGASPKAAAQSLVGQPAIQQEVSGKDRRPHLQHAQRRIPGFARGGVGMFHLIRCLIAVDDRSRFFGVPGLSQQENDVHLCAPFERKFNLKRGRGI